ncbi:MAG: hypothetical protein KDA37_00245 [Planctomycetales bacterium]|nr:hypothetical protein [Planctomycetales bacterium]
MRRNLTGAAALWALATILSGAVAQADTYADIDFLLLAPRTPSTGFVNNWYDRGPLGEPEAEGAYSDNLQFATRLTVGGEDCSGFGGRVRWFQFDNDLGYDGLWNTGVATVQVAGTTNLDVDAIDFDVTQRGSFCCWNLLGSAGLRYGRAELGNNNIPFNAIPAFIGGGAGFCFEGLGPTIALEGRRPVCDTGFSLFAAGRTSLLWGDSDTYSPFRANNRNTIRDDTVQVWEIQMGVEYAMCIGQSQVETGVFWETQRWDSDSDALGDLDLMGLGIHAGLTY